MQEISSIRNINNINIYAAKQQSQQPKTNAPKISAREVYQHNGLNALGAYNQASVSFEGLGIFKKLADKIKDKKDDVIAKHQQRKEERLQKKEEKLQRKEEKMQLKQQQKAQAQAAKTPQSPAVKQEQPKQETVVPEKEVKPQEQISQTPTVEVKTPEKKEIKPEISEEVKQEEIVETKPDEATEDAVKEFAPEEKTLPPKKPETQYDMGFYDNSHQMKYLVMKDKETGIETVDWYKEDGSIRGVQTIKPDGTDSFLTFYDKDSKQPKEEFITLPDGKHQYIKYRKNGLLEKVFDLQKDNKTIIKYSRYHYNPETQKLENIKTVFSDKSAENVFYREDGSLFSKQFEKKGKITHIDWYWEDGKTVKSSHTPLDDGKTERVVYGKDGRILISDIVNADKRTSSQFTEYFYQEGKNDYYKTKTIIGNTQINTWYDEKQIPECDITTENGVNTKSTWYYEDGETQKIQELYLSDGRKQQVQFDKSQRWNDFYEFPSKDSQEFSKHTHYFYKDETDVPRSSITTYPDGKSETVWYNENENMTCRETKQDGVLAKREWFKEDGETVSLIHNFTPDGNFTVEIPDETKAA